jgi:HEAT repeat protein
VQALGRLRDPASAPVLELVHASDPDGRARRQAWEALAAVRQGRGEPDAIVGLRARVSALSSENDALRARLDRLEGARGGSEKSGGA